MDRVDQVAAALTRAGETTRIHRSPCPEIEDDSLYIADKLHVQVGESYLILVCENADGTFTFFPEATSLEDLLSQIREARSKPEPDPGAQHTHLRAAPAASFTDGSAPVYLPIASEDLPTREQLVAEGATIHRSAVDDAEYVLIGPGATRQVYAVLRFDAVGKVSVVAESTTEDGASRALDAHVTPRTGIVPDAAPSASPLDGP